MFAGAFDPPTIGHYDLIRRASSLVSILYVAVGSNSTKTHAFTSEERVRMLGMIVSDIPHIRIISFSGLVVDFAKAHGVNVLIRGLRNTDTFQSEFAMAAANRHMTGIETLWLPAQPCYTALSSTLVREIARNGGSLRGFVCEQIEGLIQAKFKRLQHSV